MIVELSRASLLQRLGMARPGQFLMYHVGFLYNDRIKNRKLNAVAHAVYDEYKAGNCVLVQRRLGDMMYEYYAVRR